MNNEEYYDVLLKHDWFGFMSDQNSVVRDTSRKLSQLAYQADTPEKQRMYTCFRNWTADVSRGSPVSVPSFHQAISYEE